MTYGTSNFSALLVERVCHGWRSSDEVGLEGYVWTLTRAPGHAVYAKQVGRGARRAGTSCPF
jgi:hypothetical protein